MPFPFSFVFSVPGIANPFTSPKAHHSPSTARAPSPASTSSQGTKKPELGMSKKIFSLNRSLRTDDIRRRPLTSTPSLEPPPPTSRKRGWVPSSSEPSIPTTFSATVQTSSSGCLNPSPSNLGNNMQVDSEQHHEDDMEADLPPPKRRKTFAGSIASTALSAALIGTAVGLTVYRLWKGKGKQTEVPPPPYEQREWASSPSVGHGPKADEASGPHYVPVSQPDPCEYSEPSVTSSVQRRRQRHVAGRRSLPRQRRVHPRTQPTYPHAFNFSPPEHSAHVPVPQFNFDSANQSYEEEPEADTSDQMDWIGDKLAQLIEEGKRALGKEIVITAEAEEDEEDDGSGQWVEDDEGPIPSPSSGSFCKSHRPCDIAIVSPPPQYSSPWRTPRSPNSGRFDTISRPDSTYSSPRNRARADSVDSLGSILSSQHQEDGSAWQSPEMREAMERARQSYLQRGQMAS